MSAVKTVLLVKNDFTAGGFEYFLRLGEIRLFAELLQLQERCRFVVYASRTTVFTDTPFVLFSFRQGWPRGSTEQSRKTSGIIAETAQSLL